jgi:hypothetical protein
MIKVFTHSRSAVFRASAIAAITLIIWQPALGQAEDENPRNDAEVRDIPEVSDDSEALDDAELLDDEEIDVQGSIDDAEDKRGITVDGDLRLGYVFAGEDFQGISFGDEGDLRARWRLRSIWGITERLRAVARLAGICSTIGCEPDFILQPNIPTASGIRDGQFTIDSLFFQWFRNEEFNVAVGRMETKYVARGGVFAKSLDRNDSNNLRVNWTDGLHTTFRAQNGWNSKLILQYNSPDGASNIRRYPLDFSDNGSRVSTVIGFENVQPRRRMVQRALDVTYMPSSLKMSGLVGSPVEDYWAIVTRWAARWPVRSEGWRLRISSEVGYAPTTPGKLVSGIVGSGDTDGLAWNVTTSIMEFLPNHSIGINFAETGAGWLMSPQYADNERLLELRYMWRPTDRLTLDVRGRWRDEISQRIIEDEGRDRFDFYARFTWSFTVRGSVN